MINTSNVDDSPKNAYRTRVIRRDQKQPSNVGQDNESIISKTESQDPASTAEEEIIKESIKEEIQHTEKLNQLVTNSTTVIYKTKTIFPFVFFPNEIIVTLSDVSVVFGKFFTSREIRTVSISKIAEVIVTTGFMFAQLRIIDIEFSQLTMEIDYLDMNEALKAKRLIQGLLFATKEGVDLTKVHDDDLVGKIEELGRVQGEKLDQR